MKRNVSTIAYILSLSGILTLTGCQTTPQQNSKPSKSVEKPKSEQPDHRVATPDGVKITPYERPEIKREKVPVVIAPQSKPQTQKFEDGENIPAFKQLIQQTQTA
ncbi:MAG: tetratricopeptide repeat protein, partial [Pseudomonadota bacterium]